MAEAVRWLDVPSRRLAPAKLTIRSAWSRGLRRSVIGIAVNNPINRNVGNASFELRPPTLSRIFDHKPFGRAIKHTIEPYAIYRYQSGIDNFSQILRFDERDILADTNEVEYGFVNRLFSKKTKLSPKCFQHPEYSELLGEPDCRPTAAAWASAKTSRAAASEIFSWAIAQKYFGNSNFGGALVPGTRNVFDSTVDFTGIAFLTEPRIWSPIISRLRASAGLTDFQWDLDYDPGAAPGQCEHHLCRIPLQPTSTSPPDRPT